MPAAENEERPGPAACRVGQFQKCARRLPRRWPPRARDGPPTLSWVAVRELSPSRPRDGNRRPEKRSGRGLRLGVGVAFVLLVGAGTVWALSGVRLVADPSGGDRPTPSPHEQVVHKTDGSAGADGSDPIEADSQPRLAWLGADGNDPRPMTAPCSTAVARAFGRGLRSRTARRDRPALRG